MKTVMMKTRVIQAVFVAAILFGCAPMMLVGSRYSKYGSTIEVLENGADARIEYQSRDHMLSEVDRKADVLMWSKEETASRRSKVPPGGYVFVYISGPTIHSANTKYWKYIVQSMDGEEILRKQGKDDVPEYTTSWWNIDGIYLKEDPGGPFKIYILDELRSKRSGFVVYPGQ